MCLRIMRFAIVVLVVFGVAGTCAQAKSIDLLAGLQSGVLTAQFQGAGESAVTGTVQRTSQDGPDGVTIAPGTFFMAQGGRQQNMTNPRPMMGTNFGSDGTANITVATACTDFGLPAPTASTAMIPGPCPDPRLASLVQAVGRSTASDTAIQLAVWAIANDVAMAPIQGYLRRVVPNREANAGAKRTELLADAADLLRQAGLDPRGARMYRTPAGDAALRLKRPIPAAR
jgi:hypothetical protein